MTQQSRPPRIHDVARMAGVSVATVSRAMSNPGIVSEPTRQAVQQAIAATGYTLNLTARNLRQQQVGAVLALVPSLADPFFSRILSGISEVLRGRGLSLVVMDTTPIGDQSVVEVLAPYLNRSRCDGVIVMDGSLDAAMFRRAGCPPVVQACEWVKDLSGPRVIADNMAGGMLAVRHLADLGHRHIFHLRGPARNAPTAPRRQGVLQGLAAADLPEPGPGDSMRGDFDMQSGVAAVDHILRLSPRPTAIFCDNDAMAIGVLHGLARSGVAVPADISVMGFDDIEMSAFCHPPLTTIRQRRARIGRRAAELLLARMQGSGDDATVMLDVDLLVRESTAPPPAGDSRNA